MAQEVFMDIPRVEQMGKRFETFGSVLEGVAKRCKPSVWR